MDIRTGRTHRADDDAIEQWVEADEAGLRTEPRRLTQCYADLSASPWRRHEANGIPYAGPPSLPRSRHAGCIGHCPRRYAVTGHAAGNRRAAHARHALEAARGRQLVVTYQDRVTEVQLGDRVTMRIWFRKHGGRVVYIPGVSPVNPTMERDGLSWVGVRLEEGGFVSTLVDPRDGYLRGRLKFVGRDPKGVVELKPEEDPQGDDSFAAPF